MTVPLTLNMSLLAGLGWNSVLLVRIKEIKIKAAFLSLVAITDSILLKVLKYFSSKVLHESVFGTIGMTILFLVIGLVFGAVFGFSSRQIIFVAICLSFTSTPVVSKLLDAQKSRKGMFES